MNKFSCETVADAPLSGVFDAIIDVGSFDQFIPWVQAARVEQQESGPDGTTLEGSILVSLRAFSGWVSARVLADPKDHKIT